MSGQKQAFRAGTHIAYGDERGRQQVEDLCHIYFDITRPGYEPEAEYVAHSLTTGRHGFGDTPEAAYTDLIIKLSRELAFAVEFEQDYACNCDRADDEAFARAETTPVLPITQQAQCLRDANRFVGDKSPPWHASSARRAGTSQPRATPWVGDENRFKR